MSKLKVGIDVRIVEPHMRGIGIYVERLVHHIAKMDACELVLFGNEASRPILAESAPNAEHIDIPYKLGDQQWERQEAGNLSDKLGLDLYHGPSFTLAATGNAAKAVTVHDLSFWEHPEFYELQFVEFMERSLREALGSADLVLTNSETTAAELKRFVSDEGLLTRATLLGVDPIFRQKPDPSIIERLRKQYQLREHTILAVGMGQGRKNTLGVLRAFARLRPELRAESTLLIVGEGWEVNPIARHEAQFLEVLNDVVITGEVSQEDLAGLYHLAAVLCYPSIHEGFGLPVVEAMAAGTPVVTADRGALGEVAGDAAVLVDPSKPSEISQALAEVLDNEILAAGMRAKGRARAEEFTWERTARQTLSAYEEAVRQTRGGARQGKRASARGRQTDGRRGPQKLRIGIDARFYGSIGSGTGRYTTEIVKALANAGQHELVLFGPPRDVPLPEGNIHSSLAGEARFLDPEWEQQRLSQAIEAEGVDVYFSPTGLVPATCSAPAAIVVHDLGFEHHPGFYSDALRKHLKEWLPKSCEAASHVIAVSRFTARDLIRTYGVSPEKVSVVYNGVDHLLVSGGSEGAQATQKYVLALSSGGPNKNLPAIVEAFELALSQRPDLPHDLVLAGNVPDGVKDLIGRTRTADRVRTIEGLSDAELARLMSGASCLVHLSYCEGFGFPVAEAMALGVPVVSSNRASLPEVVGDSALLVDPDDSGACGQALLQVLGDREVADLLARNGRERAQSFRWRRAAEQITQVLGQHATARRAEPAPKAIRPPGQNLRIGLVSTWGVDCGIGKYAEDLGVALAGLGHEVLAFAEDAEGAGAGPAGTRVLRCWLRGDDLERLHEAVLRDRVDVLNIQYHPTFFRDDMLARLLWRLKRENVTTLLTIHEIDPRGSRAVFLTPDRILVHTETCERALRSRGISAAIDVVPIGVGPSRPTGLPAGNRDPQLLLSVGFLQPSKGFHGVIDALPLLKRDFPRLRYRIAGARRPGAERYPEELLERARARGVAEMVELKEGYLSDEEMAAEIERASVVAFPYLHQTFGASAAIAPALAAGAAIVTSRASFFDDLGDSVLKAGSPEECAQAVRSILSEPSLADSLRARAGELARQRAWPNLAKRHESAYRDAISRQNQSQQRKLKPWISCHIISKETDPLGQHFFRSCLEAIRGYPDELIIVDNGSSDDVLEMVRSEMGHFNGQLILKPEVDNFRDLRNIALRATNESATHIHWIDTDEIFFPEQLPELRQAMEYEDISMIQTVLVHFMIDPVTLQDRQLKKNVFRYAPGMQWSKSVHEVLEGLPEGRTAFIPVEHLHFGYCRPQWQTFLKWIRYAILEHGSADMYRREEVDGRILPWMRGARTPDGILDERLPMLSPYGGPYPRCCAPWFEPWQRSGKPWKEHLRQLVDHSDWDWWQGLRARTGSWEETLPYVIERMGWREERRV